MLCNNFKGVSVCVDVSMCLHNNVHKLWLLDLLSHKKLMVPNSILTCFYLQKHFLILCHINFCFRLFLHSWKYSQKFVSQTWFPKTEIINQTNFKKISQFNFLKIKIHASHENFAEASLFPSVEVNKHISL